MANFPKFRSDVDVQNLVMRCSPPPVRPVLVMGMKCRARQNNLIIRTDESESCFPKYTAIYDWGNIDNHKFRCRPMSGHEESLPTAFVSLLSITTLPAANSDARVIKFIWTNLVTNPMKGGARSFENKRVQPNLKIILKCDPPAISPESKP